jgi:shikimate kinase
MAMQSDVILIGPSRVGKSQVGKLLATQLERPFVDLARIAPEYYAEQGHDREKARQAWEHGGLAGFLHYQAPFEVYALERGLQQHAGGVIELGALQVALADDALIERVRQALHPYRTVVLLLPAADAELSIQVLDQRERVLFDGMELNEHFVRHHSNHDLAKICVYTKGQTPQETCEAIMQQLDPASPEVFLIGPVGAGKSTLGKLLAQRLGRPQIALDNIRWDYYKEIGYDETVQREIDEREGFAGVYRYWKPFEAHAVERALHDHQACVMDFGAGHSIQERDADFARIQALLAPYPNVVLLLPSPDLDESVAILEERNTQKIGQVPLTRYLVTHPAFQALATHVVYTQGSTPEQTSEAILGFAQDSA